MHKDLPSTRWVLDAPRACKARLCARVGREPSTARPTLRLASDVAWSRRAPRPNDLSESRRCSMLLPVASPLRMGSGVVKLHTGKHIRRTWRAQAIEKARLVTDSDSARLVRILVRQQSIEAIEQATIFACCAAPIVRARPVPAGIAFPRLPCLYIE